MKLARRIWHTAKIDVRGRYLGQMFPLKPTVLNLLINDVCNSRCQMCSVWKQKRDRELTPDELASILSDSLFRNLRYVGVSGGEPTLRSDLPEIYRVLVQKRPPILSTGIITNAVRRNDVIARILASAEICREASVPFNLMVSLDGVGQIHDRVRGREGNFESAMEVIRYFRDKTDIPISFGCTITKDNVWHVDELLDFARAEGLYGRFRVAEFIQRLYNEDHTTVIRNFTPLEAYHLGLFFTKLEREFEQNPKHRRTYRNIRAMLMQGARRTVKCPYQTHAVVLDCRGQLLYCSPKSPILGNTLETSAQRIYLDNIDKRRQILAHDCQNCIHDYHTQATILELLQQADAYLWRHRLSVRSALARSQSVSKSQPVRQSSAAVRHALIVGWYGTETAGDKAILGEIVHQLKQRNVVRITLASLNPYLSEWTVKELGYPEIEIIATHSDKLLRMAAEADETIMGGGPLMDLTTLGFVLRAFVEARKSGRRTRIAGCGIGPLHQAQRIEAVKRIVELANVIELRDSQSVEWAIKNTGRTDVVNSGDPAVGFVRRWQTVQAQHFPRQKTLNCYFREWTSEYQGELSEDEFDALQARFEDQLGSWVASLCKRLSLRPRMLAMHHFVIGGDDREFNRRFANLYLSGLDPIVEMHPFTVYDILQSMQEAILCLTMRFHSTLFAHTLDVPFVAVDYTHGGKILGFLADHHSEDKLITLEQVADGQWRDRMNLLAEYEHTTD